MEDPLVKAVIKKKNSLQSVVEHEGATRTVHVVVNPVTSCCTPKKEQQYCNMRMLVKMLWENGTVS